MITPGELHNGMMIAVIDGKPLVAAADAPWQEKEDSGGMIWFTTASSTPKEEPNMGRVFSIAALQLPMVLAVDVLTKRPVVFDARKLVFREISKEYVDAYCRLFNEKKKDRR
jgi:hypothetical protein